MRTYRRAAKPVDAPTPQPATSGNGIEAEVRQYLLNPRGEVDGFLLVDGSLIKFPPHLSRELAQVAAPGDSIVANGNWEEDGLLKGHIVFNPKSGVALRDIKPTPPDRTASLPPLKPMQASGKILYLKRNSHGDPDAVILEDGSFVHFPPHAAKKQFVDLIEEGMKIFASGFGTESEYGRSLTAALLGPKKDAMDLIEPPQPKRPRHAHGPKHHGPHHDHHDEHRHGHRGPHHRPHDDEDDE